MLRARETLALATCALALAIPCARGEDDKEAKKEEAALAAVVDELVKLARACDGAKAVKDARAELDLALAVAPGSKKAKDELEKLAKKEDRPAATWAAKFEKDRKKSHDKCAGTLADQALSWQKAKDDERAAKLCHLIHQAFPECDKQLEKAGYKWFEPYLDLLPATQVKLLEAGGEEVDGKWTEGPAVEALNKKHATWTDPWVISDDVHELRTTMPLRTAKRILLNVGLYRKFFLERFQGAWDLKAPKGKLPVILTATQAEHAARLKEEAEKRGGKLDSVPNGAALYLQTNGDLNPCFVTFEPLDATGKSFKVDFDGVQIPLKHEITHQICFELSKHDYDRTRGIKFQFWAVEGIANFMEYYTADHGRWHLARPARIPMGPGYIEGAFAYTKNHIAEIPEIKDFVAIPHEKFLTVENYHIAATLAYFLLEGENGKYRDGFIKLCETVHKVHDAADTFETCFKGMDLSAMQREWRSFVNKIPIDP
jgi:hypothetical protein